MKGLDGFVVGQAERVEETAGGASGIADGLSAFGCVAA
jgi:hypothetical protein